MSEHLRKHRVEMERQARPAIAQFVVDHPHYAVDADQSGNQSATNYVFFGHRGRQPVVFKYFCQDERKEREVYALRHFAQTGLVPQLLADYSARLIVLSRIPGSFLSNPEHQADEFRAMDPEQVGYTLGQATAHLTHVPMSAHAVEDFERRFYDGLRLHEYLQGILQAGRAIHQRVDCYKGAIFGHSLASIEENLAYILGQQRLLYHQDAMNMHFLHSRFTGFFDLEMCRVGTEAMQLGSLWWALAVYQAWAPFVQGYAAVAQRQLSPQDFAAGQAFAHFLVWRYISDYGDWHGESMDATQMATAAVDAVDYQQMIELIESAQ